jgi:hypothetical protein
MIQIQQILEPKSPVISCDVCGHLITNAAMAMVRWRRPESNTEAITQLEFCHKGECDRDDKVDYPWWELRHFLGRLIVGVGMNPVGIVHAIEESTGVELKRHDLIDLAAEKGMNIMGLKELYQ